MGVIKNLKTLLGTKIFPVTLTKAVYTSNGRRLDNVISELGGKVLWTNTVTDFSNNDIGFAGQVIQVPGLYDYDMIKIVGYCQRSDQSILHMSHEYCQSMIKSNKMLSLYFSVGANAASRYFTPFDGSIEFEDAYMSDSDSDDGMSVMNTMLIPSMIIGYNLNK